MICPRWSEDAIGHFKAANGQLPGRRSITTATRRIGARAVTTNHNSQSPDILSRPQAHAWTNPISEGVDRMPPHCESLDGPVVVAAIATMPAWAAGVEGV